MFNIIFVSSLALGAIYLLVTDKIDKVIVTSITAILIVIFGQFRHFYSQKEAFLAIDFNTLGLLLGMMILIAILRKTGFFTYVAICLAKFSKGKPLMLMALLGISTAFISMLVDNVTTVIIVAPLSILVCDILCISPLPILMTEILLSNVGGVGTLIGDPPNILIGSSNNLSFNDFLAHLFPVTVVIIFFSFFILKFVFKKYLAETPKNLQAVLNIDAKKAIKDPSGMAKCLIILAVTFLLFFAQEHWSLEPSFIALLGAGGAFLLLRPDPEKIFHDVEWPVLTFFASFFVIVRGLENTGILSKLAERTVFLAQVDMRMYKILLLWFSGIFTSFIGSVPFTMVMIPIIKNLTGLGVDNSSLWWILAMGVGFGANGLPMGSAAGIVGISVSKKSRTPIDTKTWFASGLVTTIATLFFITILILLGLF